jgi:hypothetical protein
MYKFQVGPHFAEVLIRESYKQAAKMFLCAWKSCVLVLSSSTLKELSHEIEMGCLWYGWTEPSLEMNL